MSFARFLKNLLKNCQRIRDNYKTSDFWNWNESVYLVKKYLDEQLTPYGIIGSEHHIRSILRFKIIKKKTIKKLGKVALRKGKYLFLKDIVSWWYDTKSIYDLREIEFKEFDMDKLRRNRYVWDLSVYNWKEYPF